MGIDRARNSYDETRQYRSVVVQQGRVTLEADANEAELIRAEESRAGMIDVIGPTGTPDDGFLVRGPTGVGSDPWSFSIAAGTIYVGGLRVQNAKTLAYADQRKAEWADFPAPGETVPAKGPTSELVYLEVVEQEVSAVEDRALREVALGGPDTAGRTRLIQRVRRGEITATACDAGLHELLKVRSPGLALDGDTMRLRSSSRLQVGFVKADDEASVCQPIEKSGFLGAENQLIRVQVTRDPKKLVWGYDNASFLYRVKTTKDTDVAGATITTLTLEGEPVDEHHRPQKKQWVEVLRAAVAFDGQEEYVAAAVGELHAVESYDANSNAITLASKVEDTAGPQLFARIWEGVLPYAAGELRDRKNAGIGVTITPSGTGTPGDFWMIGVRPTHPDRLYPARLDKPQPPDGPKRWATPLATIRWDAEGKTGVVHDCRRPFKPLTEDDDLELHNRYLHGWGVVCGLQVRCLPPQLQGQRVRGHEWVAVWNGYAIDPKGRDIRFKSSIKWKFEPIHVGELAVMEKALSRDAQGKLSDGSVSLWIDHERRFHVDPYQKKELTLAGALQDTLLRDIFEGCILNVVKFLQAQIIPGEDDGLVGPAAKRMIALQNLLVQLVLKRNTRWVYLSGEADPNVKGTEDAILRELFVQLKELLESKSFCALYENVDYPSYDVYRDAALGRAHPYTLFGTGRHARIRANEPLKLLATCGGDAKINVYSWKTRRIMAVHEFPGHPDAQVQDIAFSADGNEIYAIAWTGNAKVDSTFAMGEIKADGSIAWGPQEPAPGLKLVTLAAMHHASRLFVAARGMGVYTIEPHGARAPALLGNTFRASGHVIVGREERRALIFAGASTDDTNPVRFTEVLAIDARNGTVVETLPLRDLRGDDYLGEDLEHAYARQHGVDELYVVAEKNTAPGERHLVIFPEEQRVEPKIVALGASMSCRIAYSPDENWSLVTYQDGFKGHAYLPGSDGIVGPEFHPLQLAPCSLVVAEKQFFVLEQWSNTITAIPTVGDGELPWRTLIDVAALERYRVAAIAAYAKILGRFVQYLKDCACDHLLVDCPDGTGKVYLADISFKDGAVYQICNFHNRKYVHTFPTVEYWMSLVPVIPLLKQQIEKLCCHVFADMFEKYVPPQDANDDKPRDFSMTMLSNSLAYARDANVKDRWRAAKLQALAGGMLAREALAGKLSNPPPGKLTAPIEKVALVNEKEAVARRVAVEKKLSVRRVVVASDPILATIRAGFALPTVEEGDTIDLVTDARGTVIGVVKATPEAPDTPIASPAEAVTMRRDLDRHAKLVADLQKEMKDLREKLARLTPP